MCQQFDSRPVNALAEIAIPNGKYICYHCEPVTSTTAAARAAAEEIVGLERPDVYRVEDIIIKYCLSRTSRGESKELKSNRA
jgi:hypothetical protein